MTSRPTKKEIQGQLGGLAKVIDGASRLHHWVQCDLMENDPVQWRAKRLELEMILLRQELANLDQEIQRREGETSESQAKKNPL